MKHRRERHFADKYFVELVQQRAHLAHFQFSIGPYHAMTGNGRKALFQVLAQLVGLIHFSQFRDHLAHDLPVVTFR